MRQPDDYFKEMLKRREAELFHLLQKSQVPDTEFGQSPIETIFKESSKSHKYEEKLARVNEAFSAMEEGTYGVCLVCGEMIERQLLKKYPETNRCQEHLSVQFLYE